MKLSIYIFAMSISPCLNIHSMTKETSIANETPIQDLIIHIQGDSIAQGMLPEPSCDWNSNIHAAKVIPCPWPIVMQEELAKVGARAFVLNHSELGRKLSGISPFGPAHNGVGGDKDGRVALQQIVMLMMNQGGEQNKRNMLLIQLGANDLSEAVNVTEAQLYNKFLGHITIILTNPILQHRFLAYLDQSERAPALDFMKKLNALSAAEFNKKDTEHPHLIDLIHQNNIVIKKFFNWIAWNFILIPPPIITGPLASFERLSPAWPAIIDKVVAFFNSKNIFAIREAQEFARGHTKEFGGMTIHFDEDEQRAYGKAMARAIQLLVTHKTT